MISNNKQYKVAKSRLKEFRAALNTLQQQEMDPLWRELSEGSIKSQIEDFEKELSEYELLKKGGVRHIHVRDLTDVKEALIKARICRNWTQADLARRLKMKEQQIQRYEMSNYASASFERISEIAAVLEITLQPTNMKLGSMADAFPLVDREMIMNGFHKMKERGSLLI